MGKRIELADCMDFYAQTVLPSTHDIDVMWNLSWNEAENLRGVAYVAGIQGWWDGKVGIEKSPEYKLVATAPDITVSASRPIRAWYASTSWWCARSSGSRG